jgi:hypothetical protein
VRDCPCEKKHEIRAQKALQTKATQGYIFRFQPQKQIYEMANMSPQYQLEKQYFQHQPNPTPKKTQEEKV